MKTLAQHQRERRRAREAADAARSQRIAAILESSESVEVSLGDREKLREWLAAGRAAPIGIACDHCGTELVDRHPGTLTASMPPLQEIGCVRCGWRGRRAV